MKMKKLKWVKTNRGWDATLPNKNQVLFFIEKFKPVNAPSVYWLKGFVPCEFTHQDKFNTPASAVLMAKKILKTFIKDCVTL